MRVCTSIQHGWSDDRFSGVRIIMTKFTLITTTCSLAWTWALSFDLSLVGAVHTYILVFFRIHNLWFDNWICNEWFWGQFLLLGRIFNSYWSYYVWNILVGDSCQRTIILIFHQVMYDETFLVFNFSKQFTISGTYTDYSKSKHRSVHSTISTHLYNVHY